MEANGKVKRLRLLHNLTQEQMAEKMGMSLDGYTKLERGDRQLDLPKLERIASIFGITLLELLAIDENSIVCLINENVHQNGRVMFINKTEQISQVYYGNSDLEVENEKLKSELEYKNKELALLHEQNELLRELTDRLKSKEN